MSVSHWPLFVVLILFMGCSPSAETSDAPEAEDVVYVDVRTAEEFNEGHVVGALHLPYDQMEDRWQELDSLRDRPIVLYCRTGRRSGIAEDILRDKGFADLENGGGLSELEAEGIPTTR